MAPLESPGIPMPAPSSPRPFRPVSTALLFVAATTLAACSSPPTMQMPQTEVGVVTLRQERLSVDSELPGRTRAYQTSDVRPQVGGILRRRLFEEGADVKAGQVLYEIDPAMYRAAYDNAQGTLAQAEAAVISARPKAQRYRNLVAEDAASKQDADDATASLRQSEAAVVGAKAALQSARINLDYTRIRAPISGRIGTSAYTPGALVTAGQAAALATIHQLDPMYVDVAQSSTQLLALRRQLASGALKAVDGKAQVNLVLEDGTVYPHAGKLEVVDAAVDESTGTVKLRAAVPNPDGLLLPGMYVKAVLAMAVDEQALLVPQQAVTRDSKGDATVLLVGAGGKVEQRTIRVGDAVKDRWTVLSGLKAGDRVIVQGTQKARAGATVKAVEVDPSRPAISTPPAGAAPGAAAKPR